MSNFDNRDRPRKTVSYEHLYAPLMGKTVSSAVLMPAGACNDVKFLADAGIIKPFTTDLIVVERDKSVRVKMTKTMAELGWHRGINLTVYGCPLDAIPLLPKKLGIVSIDLMGSLRLADAQWMADVMMPALAPSSLVAVTLSSVARNNFYITEFWDAVSTHYPEIVEDFVSQRRIARVIHQRPALWLKVILHKFDFAMETYAYNDSDNPGSEMLAMRLDQFERRAHPEQYLSQAAVEWIMDIDKISMAYARQVGAQYQPYPLPKAPEARLVAGR